MRSQMEKWRDFASLFREEFFVPIVCYADESGTHDVTGEHPEAEVAVVAGYIATKDQWDWINEGWTNALARNGVPVLHMNEFVPERQPKDSPYYGWSPERRKGFIHNLVQIARANTIFGAGALVDVKAYQRILPDFLKAQLGHPWHFCFRAFFAELLGQIKARPQQFPNGEQIAFFFDRQDEFRHQALDSYDVIRASMGAEAVFGSKITFAEKKDEPPLQAVDLLVARMRKVFTHAQRKGSAWPDPLSVTAWDGALAARGNLYASYYDAKTLEVMTAAGVWPRVEYSPGQQEQETPIVCCDFEGDAAYLPDFGESHS